MSATIDSFIEEARSQLDTAYANDPENVSSENFEAIISGILPDSGDNDGVIQIAATNVEECFSDPTSVAADAYSNMHALMEAALADELNTLQNP